MTIYTKNVSNRGRIQQITLANMIDTDWTIGRQRADIAGKILADALLNREQVSNIFTFDFFFSSYCKYFKF